MCNYVGCYFFFFSSRRRHTRFDCDWSSDVCSSDLYPVVSERFLAFHPKRVAEFTAGNPVGWYKDFLETTVMPQSRLFATLQAYGEAAVGLGLVLGLLTGLTALVGLFMCVNFALAAQWMSFGQQGFHLLLGTSMVIFLFARPGRAWGIDGWILAPRGGHRRRWLRLLM